MIDLQQQVRQAVDRLVASGVEQGLQVAVYRRSELVADAVAGVADHETGRPVTSDTPFYAYSVAGPLGITDELYFGMPESELGRLARLEDAENRLTPDFVAAEHVAGTVTKAIAES